MIKLYASKRTQRAADEKLLCHGYLREFCRRRLQASAGTLHDTAAHPRAR